MKKFITPLCLLLIFSLSSCNFAIENPSAAEATYETIAVNSQTSPSTQKEATPQATNSDKPSKTQTTTEVAVISEINNPFNYEYTLQIQWAEDIFKRYETQLALKGDDDIAWAMHRLVLKAETLDLNYNFRSGWYFDNYSLEKYPQIQTKTKDASEINVSKYLNSKTEFETLLKSVYTADYYAEIMSSSMNEIYLLILLIMMASLCHLQVSAEEGYTQPTALQLQLNMKAKILVPQPFGKQMSLVMRTKHGLEE